MARVLIIAYTTYIHDGRVKRHAEALAQRGDQVDVISLATEGEAETSGVNVIGLEMPRYRGASRTSYLRSYLRFFAKASAQAFRLSLKQRYDVVIVCTMPDAAVVCAILPRLLGSKVVLDVHDTMPELYQDKFGGTRGAVGARLLMAEERLSAWCADRVLAVHDLHRERLEEAGVPSQKIRVVMNSPDPRIFQTHSNGNSVQRPAFMLACHGTITHRLGLDLAIEAIDRLKTQLPDLHLSVIGSGDYLEQARAMVERLKLGSRITFRDPVPVEKLPALLQSADAGVVPNRPTSASHLMLPVKLLEYATLEIPVIAARLRTIEHYFGGGAVLFFEPEDSADLARAIEQLYRQPALRAQLARCARETLDELSWPLQRALYYRAIDSLLEQQSG
ncbi:MAG TPA: glycosyltransferase family 4 protein [Candidatus Binataceae bacterium]